jgi:hypothetical protein
MGGFAKRFWPGPQLYMRGAQTVKIYCGRRLPLPCLRRQIAEDARPSVATRAGADDLGQAQIAQFHIIMKQKEIARFNVPMYMPNWLRSSIPLAASAR